MILCQCSRIRAQIKNAVLNPQVTNLSASLLLHFLIIESVSYLMTLLVVLMYGLHALLSNSPRKTRSFWASVHGNGAAATILRSDATRARYAEEVKRIFFDWCGSVLISESPNLFPDISQAILISFFRYVK